MSNCRLQLFGANPTCGDKAHKGFPQPTMRWRSTTAEKMYHLSSVAFVEVVGLFSKISMGDFDQNPFCSASTACKIFPTKFFRVLTSAIAETYSSLYKLNQVPHPNRFPIFLPYIQTPSRSEVEWFVSGEPVSHYSHSPFSSPSIAIRRFYNMSLDFLFSLLIHCQT